MDVNGLFIICGDTVAMRRLSHFIVLILLSFPAWADSPCRAAIEAAEQRHGVPAHLLAAIGRVESGRTDRQTGEVAPWPWTINVEGQGAFYDNKAQAIAAVNAARARGSQSIDVGCMQVNLLHHPTAFASLDQAFDPAANADYAARFLLQLYQQSRSWPKAVGTYHSATEALGADYQKKVLAIWPEEQKLVPSQAPEMARMWAATLPRVAASPFAPAGSGRIILAPGSATTSVTGRDLAAYRAAPILLAARPMKRDGG